MCYSSQLRVKSSGSRSPNLIASCSKAGNKLFDLLGTPLHLSLQLTNQGLVTVGNERLYPVGILLAYEHIIECRKLLLELQVITRQVAKLS